jgi:hypothetical protein
VYTDDIMKQDSWSDPVFIDNVGIDQDVRECRIRVLGNNGAYK